jgi:hypothetical protein
LQIAAAMAPNPRSRTLTASSSLFLDGERRRLSSGHQHHAAATIQISVTGRPAPLGNVGSSPSADISPDTTKGT